MMQSSDLGGEVAQGRSGRLVGALQRQTVVRPGQHQQLAAVAHGVVVEDERAGGGGEAVVEADARGVDGVVLVEERLVAGLGEPDEAEHAVVRAGGLDGALGAVGGRGSQRDGREGVDHVGGAGGVDDGERGASSSD
ncbi:hypothetical protein MKX07_001335 [Trichoderma sp. CBMAI-0711]|nr:hypothetical protein MKX07_001335 [Trichoderma sp. CBMAI-0711]